MMERPGRNDPCPCGSGLKYKKCCLPHEEARGAVAERMESTALPLLARLARFAQAAAAAPLETVAREEFPFWHGRLDRAQGARIVDFLIFEYRPKHFGRRTVEQFAVESAGALGADSRALLDAWVDAPRRLYRTGVWSGGFVTCYDVLSSDAPAIDVFDVEGAWRPSRDEAVALRPLRVGGAALCTGSPIAFSGRSVEDVGESVRRRHLDFVRTNRIVGIDDFLRLSPKALDEEALARPGSSTIVLPGVTR